MAFDAFLKLGDGKKVSGESTDAKHTGEISVHGVAWGLSNPSSIGSFKTGSGTGKATFATLTVTKKVDKATAPLMVMSATGDHFPTAVLTIRKAGGKNPLEYLIYNFEQVFVDSVQHHGSASNDDEITEVVSFSYGKIKLKYVPQNADGTGGSPLENGYDLTQNTTA